MTKRLPPSFLLGFAALLLFASSASAQVLRPSNTLFIGVRGGASAYGGELDGETDRNQDNDQESSELGWLGGPFGFNVGPEIGYQFSEALGLSVSYLYGTYPNLDEVYPVTGGVVSPDGEDTAQQIQAYFRYLIFPRSRITPFVQIGATYAFGANGSRAEGVLGAADPDDSGFGPHLGAGLDFLLGNRLSLFLEASGSMIFPDDVIDGLNPAAYNLPTGDDADFDALVMYGGGLRFYFRAPGVPVEATIDCATSLTVGQAGSFTAYSNEDATQPVNYMWNWGDGTTSDGMTASHAYSAPGTYTVTLTADGPRNDDVETCLVTVTEQQFPATLANCNVSPSRVGVGEAVTVNASISGSTPTTVTVDFGDGTTASSLPATHAYSSTGTYTVTITTSNAFGTDTCTLSVNVGDTFCQEVTELNTVYFDYEASALTSEGRSRLDENIEVLRRCPDICVMINAYADETESDKLRLSQRRADEVRAYYIANGIAESRLMARGLGEAPDSNSKEDPGPGDRNARRAESIPMSCDRMMEMGGGN